MALLPVYAGDRITSSSVDQVRLFLTGTAQADPAHIYGNVVLPNVSGMNVWGHAHLGGASGATLPGVILVGASMSPAQLGTRPFVKAYHNANQSVANNTDVTLAWNSHAFDDSATSSLHNTVTNNSRFVPYANGFYLMTVNITWQGNATGYRDVKLTKNGITTILMWDRLLPTSTVEMRQSACCMVYLTTSDYVTVVVNQNSGVSLQTVYNPGDGIATSVTMLWLSKP